MKREKEQTGEKEENTKGKVHDNARKVQWISVSEREEEKN